MPLFLKKRQDHLREKMDDPDCDLEKLENTYRQFRIINKLFSRWDLIYKKEIRPILQKQNGTATLLDIGFGGGDIPILLSDLAQKDGFQLIITAIEIDERSINFVKKLNSASNIDFKKAHSSELVESGATFDFVISNHVTHHLDKKSLKLVCADAKKLSTQKVLFNDIERNDFGYLFFYLFTKLFFRNSFVSYDGLISIKRSYTLRELKQEMPSGWNIKRVFPFRLVLCYEAD